MKVLLVAPHIRIPGTSGAAIHHSEFSQSLETLGVDVFILANSTKKMKLGKRVLVIPSVISPFIPKRFLTSLLSTKRALDICEKYDIDLIHDRCDPGQMTGYIVAKVLNLPRLSEVNYNFLSYETKQNFFRDVIIYPVLQWIKKWWVRNIVKGAAVVTAVSRTLKISLTKEGIPPREIVVVPNGADYKKFRVRKGDGTIRKKYGLESGDLVLTIVGELGPRQAVKETVIAVHKLKVDIPNIKLVLVGSEERYKSYLDEIKQYVADNKINSVVKFINFIPHETIPEFLSVVDIALAPYNESWSKESFGFSPIKIFEYMAAGKVVATTATPWNREIIANGKNGFLISIQNLQSDLKDVLRKLKDKKLRMTVEHNARKSVEDKFNWEAIAKQYFDIYKNIARQKVS